MEKTEITIVGAGIIGLAAGAELSKICRDIFIIEKEPDFGRGTSSRNSEVIHAGLYHPKDSLKTKTCIEGRKLLYDFCRRNQIGHKKIGKLIVATNGEEAKDLENLFEQGRDNGVNDLELLSRNEIKKLEPQIRAITAVYSPSTGIIDSHGLMKKLASQFEANGGSIAYNSEVAAVNKTKTGFEVSIKDTRDGTFEFFSRVLINSAGLNSEKIALMAGLPNDCCHLNYCKGDYLRVSPNKAKLISRLVYPVPKRAGGGLGIHATLDLGGGLRLGPDDEYVEKIDYQVDPRKIEIFYESVRDFLPFINPEDLSPDMAGIRPKLQGPGEPFRDFIIKDESENGLPGLINLIGIESPGLTASLAIARIVRKLVEETI